MKVSASTYVCVCEYYNEAHHLLCYRDQQYAEEERRATSQRPDGARRTV
jgi:hypothetical protein